ncbi:hypothetical protein AGR6A_Lc140028 [Agrobacterium sp. NCPPB 925]|nr:hypothetical protein AGR6A_Lc140028 [Agrobacterium sp. NCPPB 925]
MPAVKKGRSPSSFIEPFLYFCIVTGWTFLPFTRRVQLIRVNPFNSLSDRPSESMRVSS